MQHHIVTPEQFDTALTACLPAVARQPVIAVAVSGGGDSLALALLMHDWIKARNGKMLALTVDHGLRPESALEAQAAHALLAARGIEHRILRWEGAKPTTHIQERAREARYQLLSSCCKTEGIDVLAVAHNREDQIETFWMRLAHGSGLDGLAGMARHHQNHGLHIIRPLLNFSRESLRETCRHYGVEWIEDPSNLQKKYLRPRLRAFEEMLAAEGLSPERLSQTLQKLEEARQALQALAENAFHDGTTLHEEGYITLDREKWLLQPSAIRRRLLVQVLEKLSPQGYPPAFESLDGLLHEMARQDFSGRTLHGCEILPQGGVSFLICREEAMAEKDIPAQNGALWDQRFVVSGTVIPDKHGESLMIGALKESGITSLRHNLSKDHPVLQKLDALPFKARKVLPVLRHDSNIVFIQHLGYIAAGYEAALGGLRLMTRLA